MRPAPKFRPLVAGGATLAAILGLYACGGTNKADEPFASVVMKRTNVDVVANGLDFAEIAAAPFDANGTAGTGWVLFTVDVGQLGDHKTKELSAEVVNGKATIKYFCDSALDTRCLGLQRVRANWRGSLGTTYIWVKASDGATVTADGGTAAGEDASAEPADSGSSDKPDTGPKDPPDAAEPLDAAAPGLDAAALPDTGAPAPDTGVDAPDTGLDTPDTGAAVDSGEPPDAEIPPDAA